MDLPKARFAYHIVIIDKDGNVLVSDNDSCVNIQSYTELQVGDEITLGYRISGFHDTGRRAIVRVVKRCMFYVEPVYIPKNKRHPSSGFAARDNSAYAEQGAYVTLVCTPTAKNGGKAGILQLAQYYKEQCDARSADRE